MSRQRIIDIPTSPGPSGGQVSSSKSELEQLKEKNVKKNLMIKELQHEKQELRTKLEQLTELRSKDAAENRNTITQLQQTIESLKSDKSALAEKNLASIAADKEALKQKSDEVVKLKEQVEHLQSLVSEQRDQLCLANDGFDGDSGKALLKFAETLKEFARFVFECLWQHQTDLTCFSLANPQFNIDDYVSEQKDDLNNLANVVDLMESFLPSLDGLSAINARVGRSIYETPEGLKHILVAVLDHIKILLCRSFAKSAGERTLLVECTAKAKSDADSLKADLTSEKQLTLLLAGKHEASVAQAEARSLECDQLSAKLAAVEDLYLELQTQREALAAAQKSLPSDDLRLFLMKKGKAKHSQDQREQSSSNLGKTFVPSNAVKPSESETNFNSRVKSSSAFSKERKSTTGSSRRIVVAEEKMSEPKRFSNSTRSIQKKYDTFRHRPSFPQPRTDRFVISKFVNRNWQPKQLSERAGSAAISGSPAKNAKSGSSSSVRKSFERGGGERRKYDACKKEAKGSESNARSGVRSPKKSSSASLKRSNESADKRSRGDGRDRAVVSSPAKKAKRSSESRDKLTIRKPNTVSPVRDNESVDQSVICRTNGTNEAQALPAVEGSAKPVDFSSFANSEAAISTAQDPAWSFSVVQDIIRRFRGDSDSNDGELKVRVESGGQQSDGQPSATSSSNFAEDFVLLDDADDVRGFERHQSDAITVARASVNDNELDDDNGSIEFD